MKLTLHKELEESKRFLPSGIRQQKTNVSKDVIMSDSDRQLIKDLMLEQMEGV